MLIIIVISIWYRETCSAVVAVLHGRWIDVVYHMYHDEISIYCWRCTLMKISEGEQSGKTFGNKVCRCGRQSWWLWIEWWCSGVLRKSKIFERTRVVFLQDRNFIEIFELSHQIFIKSPTLSAHHAQAPITI